MDSMACVASVYFLLVCFLVVSDFGGFCGIRLAFGGFGLVWLLLVVLMKLVGFVWLGLDRFFCWHLFLFR